MTSILKFAELYQFALMICITLFPVINEFVPYRLIIVIGNFSFKIIQFSQ